MIEQAEMDMGKKGVALVDALAALCIALPSLALANRPPTAVPEGLPPLHGVTHFHRGDWRVDGDFFLVEFAFYGAVFAACGVCELLAPFGWMDIGTVSSQFDRLPAVSTEGGGGLWPLGLGLAFPDAQFPGEGAGVVGIDIGLFTARHANVYGMQVGGLAALVTGDCAGIAVGGLCAAADNIYGVQVAGLLASSRSNLHGLQIAGYANDVPGCCTGVQAALVNMAGAIVGAQIGFTNYAREVHGLQIGLLNMADSLDGLQLGLVNFVRLNGLFPAAPLMNAGF